MKQILKKNWSYVAGAAVGGIAGYFYWQQVGCTSGTCAISSKPLNSTLYFALLGSLLFSILFKKTTPSKKETNPSSEITG
jgi:hypothetical protein